MKIPYQRTFPEPVIASILSPTATLLAALTRTLLVITRAQTGEIVLHVSSSAVPSPHVGDSEGRAPAASPYGESVLYQFMGMAWSPCGTLIALSMSPEGGTLPSMPSVRVIILAAANGHIIRDLSNTTATCDENQKQILAKHSGNANNVDAPYVPTTRLSFSPGLLVSSAMQWIERPVTTLFAGLGVADIEDPYPFLMPTTDARDTASRARRVAINDNHILAAALLERYRSQALALCLVLVSSCGTEGSLVLGGHSEIIFWRMKGSAEAMTALRESIDKLSAANASVDDTPGKPAKIKHSIAFNKPLVNLGSRSLLLSTASPHQPRGLTHLLLGTAIPTDSPLALAPDTLERYLLTSVAVYNIQIAYQSMKAALVQWEGAVRAFLTAARIIKDPSNQNYMGPDGASSKQTNEDVALDFRVLDMLLSLTVSVLATRTAYLSTTTYFGLVDGSLLTSVGKVLHKEAQQSSGPAESGVSDSFEQQYGDTLREVLPRVNIPEMCHAMEIMHRLYPSILGTLLEGGGFTLGGTAASCTAPCTTATRALDWANLIASRPGATVAPTLPEEHWQHKYELVGGSNEEQQQYPISVVEIENYLFGRLCAEDRIVYGEEELDNYFDDDPEEREELEEEAPHGQGLWLPHCSLLITTQRLQRALTAIVNAMAADYDSMTLLSRFIIESAQRLHQPPQMQQEALTRIATQSQQEAMEQAARAVAVPAFFLDAPFVMGLEPQEFEALVDVISALQRQALSRNVLSPPRASRRAANMMILLKAIMASAAPVLNFQRDALTLQMEKVPLPLPRTRAAMSPPFLAPSRALPASQGRLVPSPDEPLQRIVVRVWDFASGQLRAYSLEEAAASNQLIWKDLADTANISGVEEPESNFEQLRIFSSCGPRSLLLIPCSADDESPAFSTEADTTGSDQDPPQRGMATLYVVDNGTGKVDEEVGDGEGVVSLPVIQPGKKSIVQSNKNQNVALTDIIQITTNLEKGLIAVASGHRLVVFDLFESDNAE